LVKLPCNKAAEFVCRKAIRIHGCCGLSKEYPFPYLYARARGWVIAGGTVEMLRNRIAIEILGRNFDQRPPKPVVVKQ
jgi:alkylation response protein AidB-like acyl-CoA dehydrogenase